MTQSNLTLFSLSHKFFFFFIINGWQILSKAFFRSVITRGKNFNFRHFWRPSWILAENEKVNISKNVRDRAILSEFLTRRVVQECPMQKGKTSIFATFGSHLRF